jgi:hypothetical protein
MQLRDSEDEQDIARNMYMWRIVINVLKSVHQVGHCLKLHYDARSAKHQLNYGDTVYILVILISQVL